MAKREIPLFIFDLSRDHNLGECDFVSCTDVDNSFVAKIDYVTNSEDVITDTLRIGNENNGIKLRLEVKRVTGKNPNRSSIRTLLKKAEDLYIERNIKSINIDMPSDDDMIEFLSIMIDGNKKNITEAGVDMNERNIVYTSIRMLEAIKHRIESL